MLLLICAIATEVPEVGVPWFSAYASFTFFLSILFHCSLSGWIFIVDSSIAGHSQFCLGL